MRNTLRVERALSAPPRVSIHGKGPGPATKPGPKQSAALLLPVETAPAGVYQNPLCPDDCPDPAVLHAGDAYYLFTTSGNKPDAFPIRRSADLVHWKRVGHVFPAAGKPAWARRDFWAPEVHRVQGQWVVYYTARDADRRLCVGAARADQVCGPWTDLGAPLIRDERVGMIDAHYFLDRDGRHYLYWKEDGNDLRPKEKTPIYVRELTPDGFAFVGERARLLVNDQEWEGDLIEGPWVVRRGDWYYLFYSGNAFFNMHYAVGIARSRSPMGPFEKRRQTVLRRDEDWLGPGHGSVVRMPDGEDYFVYHAWQRGRVGGRNPRMLLMDRIHWEKGWPRINDGSPSNTPQAAP